MAPKDEKETEIVFSLGEAVLIVCLLGLACGLMVLVAFA
jgi:hypothetical protein